MAEPEHTPSVQDTVEQRLRATEPEVEVILAEVAGGGVLRVFVDHPEGVTLELCERVSRQLGDLRERYALEVSSPGRDRPLTRADHYRRFVGSRARVRTRGPLEVTQGSGSGAPRRSFTGELVGADERAVTLAAETGIITIPYIDIHRSNLVEE